MLEGSTFIFTTGLLVKSLDKEVWVSYINIYGIMDEESRLRSTLESLSEGQQAMWRKDNLMTER